MVPDRTGNERRVAGWRRWLLFAGIRCVGVGVAAGVVVYVGRAASSLFGIGVIESVLRRASGVVSFPGIVGYARSVSGFGVGRTMMIVLATAGAWMLIAAGWLVFCAVRRRVLHGGHGCGYGSVPRGVHAFAAPEVGGGSEVTVAGVGCRQLSRRRVLFDGLSLGLAAPVVVGGLMATAVGPSSLSMRVRRWRLEIDGLPKGLEGLRIVHLSDLHQGSMMPSGVIRRAVSLAIEQRPDLVVMTGDYVDRDGGDPSALAGLLGPLVDAARCPLGVLAVLGNHDWYVGADRVREALEGVGVRMIDHERVLVAVGPDGVRRLVRAGEEDRRAGRDVDAVGACLAVCGAGDFWMDSADASGGLAGLREDVPRVLLMHNPDAIFHGKFRESLGDRHPDLILAGHTHGGQVRLPGGLGNPFVLAHYSDDAFSREFSDVRVGRMIVSHGVGVTVLPARFGVPPEIGLIELVRGAG